MSRRWVSLQLGLCLCWLCPRKWNLWFSFTHLHISAQKTKKNSFRQMKQQWSNMNCVYVADEPIYQSKLPTNCLQSVTSFCVWTIKWNKCEISRNNFSFPNSWFFLWLKLIIKVNIQFSQNVILYQTEYFGQKKKYYSYRLFPLMINKQLLAVEIMIQNNERKKKSNKKRKTTKRNKGPVDFQGSWKRGILETQERND